MNIRSHRSLRTIGLFLLLMAAMRVLGGRTLNAADEPEWIGDFGTAQEAASAAEKDLLVLFTGHGWCHDCIVLDREVFRDEGFLSSTRDDFVFVELDFTFGNNDAETRREAAYRALKQKYAVIGFPNIVLADSGGVPYATRTGYTPGSGAEEMLRFIRAAQKAKRERDQSFRAAARAMGRARARELDKAILAVEPMLESMRQRADDPVLLFYADQIDELLSLVDSDADELRRKYLSRQQARREWQARDDYLEKVREFHTEGDHAGAIAFIAESLAQVQDSGLRWRLELARQLQLEHDDRHQEALENCRRLLTFEDISADERERLLDREAFNLFQLGRVDDALSHYDHRIQAAGSDTLKRLRLLGQKAQGILPRAMSEPSRLQQAIDCWRAYYEAAEKGTEHWFTATAILARVLQRAEKHNEALDLIEEFLAEDQEPWVLLDAIKSHVALQQKHQVASRIDEVKTAVQKLRQSERLPDQTRRERIQQRLEKLVEP